eukprot:TRINITY_DN5998_c0_g2_i3.p1 TRINITY_DN5998_c0_g2~~TRINITY_DN5998_c0_g2_i3.p1  ORF type:complete len:139 (+),score=17.91 TRINITY_DN5998_c0_g2_i3:83-499(+)
MDHIVPSDNSTLLVPQEPDDGVATPVWVVFVVAVVLLVAACVCYKVRGEWDREQVGSDRLGSPVSSLERSLTFPTAASEPDTSLQVDNGKFLDCALPAQPQPLRPIIKNKSASFVGVPSEDRLMSFPMLPVSKSMELL